MYLYLQQTTFENVVTKGKLAHAEQCLILQKSLQAVIHIYNVSLPRCLVYRLLHILLYAENGLLVIQLEKFASRQ